LHCYLEQDVEEDFAQLTDDREGNFFAVVAVAVVAVAVVVVETTPFFALSYSSSVEML